MTHRMITLIGLAVIFLSGYLLFSMKREVETLNFELSEIKKQVSSEKGNINLLKAQHVYLTSPARIRKLAEKYLNLGSITPGQMMPDPLTNAVQLASSEIQRENDNVGVHKASIVPAAAKSVRWRYKHMGSKYVHKASLGKKQ